MMGGYFTLALLVLILDGLFGDEVTVKEGESVTLNLNVTIQQNDKIQWHFNDTRIALINGDKSHSYVKDRRFHDRLQLDSQTGSLTIKNTATEHAGRYEAEHIKVNSSGKSTPRNSRDVKIRKKRNSSANNKRTFRLIVIVPGSDPSADAAGSGLSAGVTAGIVVVLLASVAAVVGLIYSRCRTATNGEKKNNQETDGEKSNEDPLMKADVKKEEGRMI